jgi:hypothetical protein
MLISCTCVFLPFLTTNLLLHPCMQTIPCRVLYAVHARELCTGVGLPRSRRLATAAYCAIFVPSQERDEHRKWLLKDMQFQDEYQNAFDHEQVDGFEEQALAFIKKTKRPKRQIWEIRRHLRQQIDGNTAKHDDGTTTTMVSLMKMTTMMISLQNGTRRIVTISRFISIARLSYYSSIIYHISHVQIVF